MTMRGDPLVARLKTTKEQVLYVLRTYPKTRNNDLYLLLMYWRLFDTDAIPWLELEDFKKLTNEETVRRVRCKIQADAFRASETGMEYEGGDPTIYLPDDPAIRARRRKEKAFRSAIREI